jgi:hypothetical protein
MQSLCNQSVMHKMSWSVGSVARVMINAQMRLGTAPHHYPYLGKISRKVAKTRKGAGCWSYTWHTLQVDLRHQTEGWNHATPPQRYNMPVSKALFFLHSSFLASSRLRVFASSREFLFFEIWITI